MAGPRLRKIRKETVYHDGKDPYRGCHQSLPIFCGRKESLTACTAMEIECLDNTIRTTRTTEQRGKGPKVFLDEDSKQRLAQLTMEEMNGWVWDLDDYRLFCHYADSGMSLKGVEKGFGQLSINPAGPEGDAMES
jgi:hypothetical protein